MSFTEGIIYFKLGCPCRFQGLSAVCVFGKLRQSLVEVTGIVHRGGCTSVDLLPDRDDEVFRLCGGIDKAGTVYFLCHPALHAHTVCGVHHRAVFIDTEGTGAGVKALFTRLEYEETVSLYRDIGIDTG